MHGGVVGEDEERAAEGVPEEDRAVAEERSSECPEEREEDRFPPADPARRPPLEEGKTNAPNGDRRRHDVADEDEDLEVRLQREGARADEVPDPVERDDDEARERGLVAVGMAVDDRGGRSSAWPMGLR